MPQTEHLMLGIQKVPPSQQTKDEKITPLLHSAPTENGNPCKQTPHDKTKTVQQQDSTNVVTSENRISGDAEKTSDFSFRLEFQLSTLVLISFFVAIVVPLTMITIGAVYLHSCPRNVMIPIFLIVCGSTFCLSSYGLWKLSGRRQARYSDFICYKTILWLSVLFQIGWFIAGCFWVYEAHEPDDSPNQEQSYCNKTLYQFSFWLLNSIFIVLAIAVISFFLFLVFNIREKSLGIKV